MAETGWAGLPETVETVIVGGSQAGLSASYHLTRAGREHVVLERDGIGASWRTGRWDSFTLVTPNWMLQLPGARPHGDPDGFLPRDDIIRYLEDYAASFGAPVHTGVEVERLSQGPRGFEVDTTAGRVRARNVIVCVGYFHEGHVPACARDLAPSIEQIHSSRYRNPTQLPPGGVLVVGSGQSGAQIAEELHEAGRPTILSVSSAVREPRRYRGRDTNYWYDVMGGFDRSFEDPEDPRERYVPNPHCSGKGSGHALNLERFAERGIRLVGHVRTANGTVVAFAPDMIENVRRADAASKQYMKAIDHLIAERGMSAPAASPENTDDGEPESSPVLEETDSLDLAAEEIATVVWATGFRCDYRWLDIPALDSSGYPRQRRGVSPVPGLYFCGLHWMHCLKSGLFFGVGEDARHVTNHLMRRVTRRMPASA